MLKDFSSHLADRPQAMQTALQAGDAPTLSRLGHNLKGLSASFDADRLSSLAEQVEIEASQGNLSCASDLIEAIGSEITRVQTFIQGFSDHPGT